jgi:hypothetical protein
VSFTRQWCLLLLCRTVKLVSRARERNAVVFPVVVAAVVKGLFSDILHPTDRPPSCLALVAPII